MTERVVSLLGALVPLPVETGDSLLDRPQVAMCGVLAIELDAFTLDHVPFYAIPARPEDSSRQTTLVKLDPHIEVLDVPDDRTPTQTAEFFRAKVKAAQQAVKAAGIEPN